MNKFSRPLMTLAALASVGAGFGVATLASAKTNNAAAPQGMMQRMQKPLVAGKVTAISGTTLTVESVGPKDSATTTYTVDISNASFVKYGENGPVTGSAADIKVGSHVAIDGTASGTSVTATKVMSGMMGRGAEKGMKGHGMVGTVQSVNGSTITMLGKDGKTYTVNAGSATMQKIVNITAVDIKAGDTLGVAGTITGTTVDASHIMDGMPDMKDILKKVQ